MRSFACKIFALLILIIFPSFGSLASGSMHGGHSTHRAGRTHGGKTHTSSIRHSSSTKSVHKAGGKKIIPHSNRVVPSPTTSLVPVGSHHDQPVTGQNIVHHGLPFIGSPQGQGEVFFNKLTPNNSTSTSTDNEPNIPTPSPPHLLYGGTYYLPINTGDNTFLLPMTKWNGRFYHSLETEENTYFIPEEHLPTPVKWGDTYYLEIDTGEDIYMVPLQAKIDSTN